MTKKQSFDQRQAAMVVILIAVFAVIALFRMVRGRSSFVNAVQSPMVRFRIQFLSEEAGSPGKVIPAIFQGNDLAEYTCTENDAAVATLALVPDGPPPTVSELLHTYGSIEKDDAVDNRGDRYAVVIRKKGNLYFVIVQKGFAKLPTGLHFIGRCLQGSEIASASIPFDKIAEPKRILDVPTPAQQQVADRIASAEFVQDPGGYLLRTVGKSSPDEFSVVTPEAFSYAPASKDFAMEGGISRDYAESTDAVKLRIERYRPSVEDYVLNYTDAQIVNVGGYRYLRFPTKQEIGSIGGHSAGILDQSDAAQKRLKINHSFGFVPIRIQMSDQPVRGRLECVSVRPSAAEMGLDWLDISLDRYHFTGLIRADPTEKKSMISNIPKLTLTFRLRRNVLVSTRRVVVKMRHVKKDLVAFPPVAPPPSGIVSSGVGGSFSPNYESDGVR